LLDRAPSSAESQLWLQYYKQTGMDFTSLANAMLSSTEFSQKYGSLTNTQFVEQIYQNALGRDATVAELQNWLTQLSANTVTKAGLAIAVSESAEHVADGNIYQVTNNTYNTSGTFTLDHTTDSAVANAIVQNLYESALGRAASASELSTYSGNLLNGTKTETQIAAALTATSEFTSKYGSMSNADFVSQIFANGLGRLPTTAEAQYWTAQLASGAVSKADLVAAMSQSPDHLQTGNQQATTLTVSGTGNTIHATGDTLNFTAGSGGTVDSSGNILNLVSNITVTIAASGDTINATSGDAITFTGEVSDTVNGSGAAITVASSDTITFGANASDTISGSGATLNAVSTDILTFAASSTDTVSGSGVTVNAAASDTLTISSGIVNFGASTAATINGTGNTINAASGDTITLGANASDTINGSGATINAGSTDTVTFGANLTDTVSGSGVTIAAANGDSLTASSDTINFAAGATGTVTGSSNTINAGQSDTLTVSGNSNAFVFQPAFGQDIINGFTSTDSMTLSTSDFANWQALLSHTSQVGSDTVITLDASDTITLKGVTASNLQSSQFHFH
jgi:hypothetical protein